MKAFKIIGGRSVGLWGLGLSLLVVGSCKQVIAPQGPYLVAEPLGAVFAGSDSANVLTYSNPVRIRMSDWSSFPLTVVAKSGDTNAFVYTIDEHDTTIHFLTFTPTQTVFDHPPKDNMAVVTLSLATPGNDDVKKIDASLTIR
jgi:hypothetical protein